MCKEHVTGKEHKKLNKVNLNLSFKRERRTNLFVTQKERTEESDKALFFLGLLNLVDKDRIEDI